MDDCYINWPYGEDKLKELHDILNSLDGSIQLTAETSCKELPFLDVMIRIKQGEKTKTMPSEIGFPSLTSDAFRNQKPNKQTSNEYSNRGLLIAAVFHFVHPVGKDSLKHHK